MAGVAVAAAIHGGIVAFLGNGGGRRSGSSAKIYADQGRIALTRFFVMIEDLSSKFDAIWAEIKGRGLRGRDQSSKIDAVSLVSSLVFEN